jgi:hypothetical protein
MSAAPSSIVEPIWAQFAVLIPGREDHRPLGERRDAWIGFGLLTALEQAYLEAFD